MTIAILSNVNVMSLVTRAKKELEREDIYTPSGYNTWVQELSNPVSPLNNLSVTMIFLVLHGEELLGQEGISDFNVGKERLASYLDCLENYTIEHPQRRLFVSTLDVPMTTLRPVLPAGFERKLALFWRDELAKRNIATLDLEELVANIGREKFYSPRMWLLGSIPFSQTAELSMLREITRLIRAARGIKQKCLALDLDNTLWGGVIGENGVSGILLSSHQRGSEYRVLQQRILDLKKLGVLLAVVSKNNMEDALIPFRQHPDMLLKESDIVAFYANWEPKAHNIELIAKELNIGVDSFVFIDDNPIEREAVRIALPDVVVPEFPSDSSLLPSFIERVAKDYFLTLSLTDEDQRKTEQYQTEKKRASLKAQHTNLDDYLRSLAMVLSFTPLQDKDIPRVAQLTQKTNQFNLTTRRYTGEEIKDKQLAPGWKIWVGGLRDTFGSHGQVIVAIVEMSGKEARIDTFLMSCRVMGRGVEQTFLHLIEQELLRSGVEKLLGEFISSPKNAVTQSFYPNNGFSPVDKTKERCLFEKRLVPLENIDLIINVVSGEV